MEQSYFFAFLVGLLAVAAVMACRYRYGKWLNPIAIITGWWCGWLVVALVDIIGIDAPSSYLVSLIAIGMISLLSGALSGREYRVFRLIDYSNDLLYKRIARYLLALLLIVAVVPVSIILIKGLNLQAQIGNWSEYRGAAIGGEWGHSLLFQSPITQIAYAYIVAPLIFCGILWFQSRGIKLSGIERLLAALVILLVISESISTGGRTTLYFMAIGMLYGWIFRSQHRGCPLLIWKGRWFSNILIFMFALVFIYWLAWFSEERLGTSEMGLLETLKYFAVWYHTLGFSLLDLELNNPMSRLNDAITFGQASLGGIIDYFVYPLALVGIKLESVAMGNGIYQNVFIPIGFSEVRGTIYANGYYTVFYSLFQDFRWPGVIGGCFFYGRLLNRSYCRYIWHGRFSSLYLLNTLMFLGLFGIFQSPLESPGFWVAVLGAFIIAKMESSHVGSQ